MYIASGVKKNPNVADLQMLASNYTNFTGEELDIGQDRWWGRGREVEKENLWVTSRMEIAIIIQIWMGIPQVKLLGLLFGHNT